MRPLCVIPARRGSKRLPLKNILPMNGKPMLAYSVEAARASGLFTRVFVSTEDAEIGVIAKRFGAEVHQRPPELAADDVSATEVCIELYHARQAQGESYDAIICLQPSSPGRTAEDIRRAWEAFCQRGADFLVSVTPIDPHCFHWAVQRRGDWWKMVFGDTYLKERQVLPPVYRPNGSIKIGQSRQLVKRRNFFGRHLAVYEMPEERSAHVATECDFRLAQCLLPREGQP